MLGELILPNHEVIGLIEAVKTGAVAGELVGDTVIDQVTETRRNSGR
jgi:hypothetical protein